MRVKLIESIVKDGRIFSVTFTKKNGEERVMTARLGVKKGINGKGMKYSARSRNMLPVFDMQKNAFRMINCDTVTRIKAQGDVLTVNN